MAAPGESDIQAKDIATLAEKGLRKPAPISEEAGGRLAKKETGGECSGAVVTEVWEGPRHAQVWGVESS